VAGAYVVVFVLVLVYVAIMAVRLSRIERELVELLAREAAGAPDDHGQGSTHASSTPAQAGVSR
jgi:CcmD family protein